MTTKATQKEKATMRKRERGTSLIEVLVVLVVLVLAVFSIIRIFPIGLLGLRQAENRTLAGRLGSQLMEQIKADNTNLPQGVLFNITEGPRAGIVNNEDPDNLKDYLDDPDNRAYFSDVNKFRFIEGEAVNIPLPTALSSTPANPTASGSLYTVKFSPLYMAPEAGDPNAEPNASFVKYLNVYGAPLRGISIESDQGQNQQNRLRGLQSYLIDYGDEDGIAYIMFYPRRASASRPDGERTFRITFSYEDNNGNVVSVAPFPIEVPDADEGVWQKIAYGGQEYKNLFEGSEVVSRQFDRLKAYSAPGIPTDWDDNDPYQYKLLSSNIAPESPTQTVYANMGVLAFNPAGANYSERTAFGQQAFTAYIDYSVLDWHILREDREVPDVSDGAVPLKLTLNFIKRIGDTETDMTSYTGLYRDVQPDKQVDIQVFDLQGSVARTPQINPGLGDPLRGGDYAERAGADQDKDYWIDYEERTGSYRTGTIYINSSRVPAGSQLRILYKADGDWAVALQKAYASYEQAFETDGEPSPRPSKYDQYGQRNTNLYFWRSNINKSVVATFQYTRDDDGDDDPVVRTQPITLAISEIDQDANFFDPATNKPQFAYVNVKDYMPKLKPNTRWYVFGKVNGVSLKVRVIWRDNAAVSNVWRIKDLETYITPSSYAGS